MFVRDYGRSRAQWLGGDDPQMVEGVQRNEPPAFQLPSLQFGLSEAARRYGDPSSRVAGFSPETMLALNLGRERALAGSPVTNAASTQLTNTLGGNYLNSGGAGRDELIKTAGGQYTGAQNPYLPQITKAIERQVVPAVQSRFAASGGRGAGAEQGMIAEGMAAGLAPHLFADYGRERGAQFGAAGQLEGQYGAERGRQLQGATLAPGAAGQDYLDIAQLGNVGTQYDAQNQRRLTEDDDLLNQYLRQVTGSFGNGTTTTSQPFFSNPAANALGLGLGGLSAATMLRTLGIF